MLFVTGAADGGVTAVLAGNGPAGDFWAVQTLRQLVAKKDDKTYIMGTWMLDWPSFPSRGSKGGREYLPQYKDNFWWGGVHARLLENFGHAIPYMSPGGELDCSDASLSKYEKQMDEHFKTGVRVFAFKFDDVIVGMTKETAERFDNDYGKALCYFMREMDKRAKKLDPKAYLY